MSIHFPYVSATYSDMGLIFSSSFVATFDGNDISEEPNGNEYILGNTDISQNPGSFPMLIAGDDLNNYGDEFLWPVNVPSENISLSPPAYSGYDDTGGVFYIEAIPNQFNTIMDVDYSGDVAFLNDQYNKYGSNSEYSNFTDAVEGTTTKLINEVYSLINADAAATVLFKKTTEEAIELNEISILSSSLEPSTNVQVTYETTTVSTGAGAALGSGGGGGGY
tara:strand:- start:6133 stop:6795 length:663 start_codon:yes stop_codon:yes gene_type:complete